MIATFINAVFVVFGTLIGLLIKKYITENFKNVVLTSAGLVTLVIGLGMALETPAVIAALFALIIGGIIGSALKIEDRVLCLGSFLEKKTSRKDSNGLFAIGFLNASILFCSGAMSVVGPIQAGTIGDYEILLIKSVMDGFMAIIFAANYGIGVMASALTIIVYQGFFTYSGAFIEPLIGEIGISALGSVGGFLLLLIAFNILSIRETKVANFIPALVFAPIMQYFYSFLPL